MTERRVEPRFLCSDLIKVCMDGAQPAELIANLEDISPSGACLQLDQAVAPGVRITLRLGRRRFRGRVRYCVRNEIGYFAGVQFDRGKKWDRKLYEPKHLLDPAQLLPRKR
ncbi:MAG TPA: PilZ domain-containing protein [Bryobacteraceae bacterium]|nr:PilZ domain-containing protein [Bryobacteraceae bacterium]